MFSKLPLLVFNVGIFDSRNDNFHSKFSINSQDHVGINMEFPEEPLHIRASGHAIRFDSRVSTNDSANILLEKYNDDYSQDQLRFGYGLGVKVYSSGVGSFVIGADKERDHIVTFSDASFVVKTIGNFVIIGE